MHIPHSFPQLLGLAVILLAGLVIAIGVVTLFFVQRLRNPPRRTYAFAVSRGFPGDPGELTPPRPFESWTFRAASSRFAPLRGLDLPVWDIPGDAPAGPVAILSPGWGDSKLGALPRLAALAPVCSRIIAWDPPGHGEAPGRCMLGTHEADAILALIERIAPPAPIVLYGWSLGAGVSIVADAKASAENRIRCVIAEAAYRVPWTPASRVMRQIGSPYAINGPIGFALLGMRLGVGPLWRGFDRAGFAARLQCPLLVLHGTEDEVCPIEDGRAIAAAAPHASLVEIEGGGHNDLWTDARFADQCAAAVRGFVKLTYG